MASSGVRLLLSRPVSFSSTRLASAIAPSQPEAVPEEGFRHPWENIQLAKDFRFRHISQPSDASLTSMFDRFARSDQLALTPGVSPAEMRPLLEYIYQCALSHPPLHNMITVATHKRSGEHAGFVMHTLLHRSPSMSAYSPPPAAAVDAAHDLEDVFSHFWRLFPDAKVALSSQALFVDDKWRSSGLAAALFHAGLDFSRFTSDGIRYAICQATCPDTTAEALRMGYDVLHIGRSLFRPDGTHRDLHTAQVLLGLDLRKRTSLDPLPHWRRMQLI